MDLRPKWDMNFSAQKRAIFGFSTALGDIRHSQRPNQSVWWYSEDQSGDI
jgi:hypothetical protein